MIKINFQNAIKKSLDDLGFKKLTTIQEKAIPLILKKDNVVIVSETGTGKTYAYLLPILEKSDFNLNKIQAIIVLPTRELARQVYSKVLFFKTYFPSLKINLLMGGSDKNNKLKDDCHILVCTPEKLKESFDLNRTIFDNLKYLVLDEADMLMDMGFFPIINQIFSKVKNIDKIPKIALSATLHEMLAIQIKKYFTDTKIIDVTENIWKNKNISHKAIHYGSSDKLDAFKNLIKSINPYFCIVFVNTKKDVELIHKTIYAIDKNVIALHGGLSPRERKNTYKAIESEKPKFLVATDLVSRGIDIDGASHIISFDMPQDDIWYVHRSGRTGRRHYKGDSFVFVDSSSNRQILRLQNKGIVWQSLKYLKNDFVPFNYVYAAKKKERTIVDEQIKKAILMSPKKVKPNYKKKLALQIADIKRKAKRARIEEVMNKERIKRYKIENAKKTREKNKQSN